MHICPISREQLLVFLNKGSKVAEIGVANGEFSRHILDQTSPNELHLIDPWEHQETDDYQADINNVSANEQNSRFQGIQEKFQAELDKGIVHIHRDYSYNAAKKFTPKYFDWIYIDGMHTKEAVLQDLNDYWSLIKDDGFVLGHDYANNPGALTQGFGVIEAVDEFVIKNEAIFFAITIDSFPTFMLAKKGNTQFERLLQKLQYALPLLIEIRDYPSNKKFEQKYFKLEGKEGLTFSF